VRIMIVEDDYLQADFIENSLKRNFGEIEVDRITTESEFRARFAEIETAPPDLVTLDIMLRWADPTSEMCELPKQILGNTFYRAGVRCLALLLGSQQTCEVPVIIYSVVPREDLGPEIMQAPPNVLYLQKDSDEQQLIRHLRSLLPGPPTAGKEAPSWSQTLLESSQAKPGWMGFSLDLKKLLRDMKNE
jgi:DNA-binding NarL/FixJ family response regulator